MHQALPCGGIVEGGLNMVKRYDCDIVVVGAGPGGSMAARYAAEGGLKVLLLEKKAEIGAPLRCAEGVAKKWLAEVGIEPDPKWICADMKGAIIRSPSGYKFQLDESKAGSEVGYVLERHLFDKALAEKAAEAGATIMMRAGVTGVIKDGDRLVGVKGNQLGEEFEAQAGHWIGAKIGYFVDAEIHKNDGGWVDVDWFRTSKK